MWTTPANDGGRICIHLVVYRIFDVLRLVKKTVLGITCLSGRIHPEHPRSDYTSFRNYWWVCHWRICCSGRWVAPSTYQHSTFRSQLWYKSNALKSPHGPASKMFSWYYWLRPQRIWAEKRWAKISCHSHQLCEGPTDCPVKLNNR